MIERIRALTPLRQKRYVWMRKGNLSLEKRKALTAKPILLSMIGNIAVYEVEQQKKKFTLDKTWWERFRSSPSLLVERQDLVSDARHKRATKTKRVHKAAPD